MKEWNSKGFFFSFSICRLRQHIYRIRFSWLSFYNPLIYAFWVVKWKWRPWISLRTLASLLPQATAPANNDIFQIVVYMDYLFHFEWRNIKAMPTIFFYVLLQHNFPEKIDWCLRIKLLLPLYISFSHLIDIIYFQMRNNFINKFDSGHMSFHHYLYI